MFVKIRVLKSMKSIFIRQDIRGATLIEILVTIFIFSLIGFVIWAFQKDIFSLSDRLQGGLSVEQEVRKALKLMSAEIRSVSPSSVGAYPLAEVGSNSFTFYSDIDEDGLKERIRYFLDGDVFKKGILKPSGQPLAYNDGEEVVVDFVSAIVNGATTIFEYYDTNYDGTTAPLVAPINIPNVRLVKITLIVDRDPNRAPEAIELSTQISMRNLKDNL